ncbi:hypothetical protein [Streptomyces sp. SID3343]|uniref:hypothetical protein n=1 Tax=Streptomyces sp. SID3343 TaxID=2690260 RepID=UPI00136AF8B3|nr:hypothetical protein [Streptomyces sp. SID3343]MYW06741.1 hypothetical protein [Streptomyces sp. SID3343]
MSALVSALGGLWFGGNRLGPVRNAAVAAAAACAAMAPESIARGECERNLPVLLDTIDHALTTPECLFRGDPVWPGRPPTPRSVIHIADLRDALARVIPLLAFSAGQLATNDPQFAAGRMTTADESTITLTRTAPEWRAPGRNSIPNGV